MTSTNDEMRFSKAGASQEQFEQDNSECKQLAQKAGENFTTGGAAAAAALASWLTCLQSRGYVIDPEGKLKLPTE